jgi:hypothetical protein
MDPTAAKPIVTFDSHLFGSAGEILGSDPGSSVPAGKSAGSALVACVALKTAIFAAYLLGFACPQLVDNLS